MRDQVRMVSMVEQPCCVLQCTAGAGSVMLRGVVQYNGEGGGNLTFAAQHSMHPAVVQAVTAG
jgi:hypothetical protein